MYSSIPDYDLIIIGGGIVGVSAAREIKRRHRNLKCAILEKETSLAYHQSTHNSGVIHAGIYYKPGSIKAKLCLEGMKLAYKFMDERGIPYKKVGKLIVATHKSQEAGLMELYKRGQLNGVPDLKLIDASEISSIEPHCQGYKALHSPHTGIVDWGSFTKGLGEDFKEMGGDIHLGFEVAKFTPPAQSNSKIEVVSKGGQVVTSSYILTCGGLYADKLAVLTGGSKYPAIVPFRGEFLLLKPEKNHLVNGNIYPVPDPRFPFLGVHFTPKLDGSIWVGPNAVLAFKREGYKYSDINLKELAEVISLSGFRKLAFSNLSYGANEMYKSIIITSQVKELQKFIPSISASDLTRGPSGVRAQALGEDGSLVEDFVFEGGEDVSGGHPRILHCRNAPSPAATSSLAIANTLADKVNLMMSKAPVH